MAGGVKVLVSIGVGFTSTVAVIDAPGQLLAVGVIVKVTVTGALVVFVKTPLIFPEPLPATPVTETRLSLVQLNVVPVTFPVNAIVVIELAEQIVCEDGVATALGVGFTSTVAVVDVPGQLLAVGVIVKVTVIGALVVFVNTPLMSPLPLAEMPVTVAVLFLVQLNVVPVVLPVSTIVVIAEAEQIVCEAGVATALGVGFTSTVAVIDAPGQPLAVGVIVKVTVIGALVVLVSTPLMSPLPLAGMPVTVPVLSLVQLNVVPVVLPVRTIVVIAEAEQIVCEAGVATALGVGFTSTVAVIDAPGQPLAVGVIVKVTVTGALVVLVSTPLMSPLPLAGMPVTVAVLSLVQLNVVPVVLPVSTIVVIAEAEQIVCEDGVATAFGVGLTNAVAVIDMPGQLFAVGVIVKVTVTGALVVFVKAPLMLPLPLPAIPVTVTVLSLIQLNVVPVTLPVNAMVVIELDEHIVWEDGVATALGVGFTSIVAVIDDPRQPLAVGVIVKVTVTGVLVVLVSIPLMSPLPLPAIPVTVTVLSLVQLNVVPVTLPVNAMVVIELAEQIVCEAGAAIASGVGSTVIVPVAVTCTHVPVVVTV
jgi:hypothetical protein